MVFFPKKVLIFIFMYDIIINVNIIIYNNFKITIKYNINSIFVCEDDK